MTTTGVIAGTPFYMAPEQYVGAATDARTDQFSFCVALHVALTGEHPFAADTIEALPDSVVAGRLRARPSQDRLSRRTRRALMRGLSRDPDRRQASMTELLAALEPVRARPIWYAALAAALMAVGIAVALASHGDEPRQVCTGADAKVRGVWSAMRAQEIARSFAATGVPYAAAASADVARVLDDHMRRWGATFTDACEATRVRGEQSEDLLDRRMTCLETQLREVRALSNRLATADAELVERASRAVRGLADVSACSDAQALLGLMSVPADSQTRARVATLRGELGEVKALRTAGRFGEAAERARPLATATQEVAYRPLEAETLLELGSLEDQAGNTKAARHALERAVWSAEAGRHDELSARSWLRLMMLEGIREARPEAALTLQPRVTAVLERLGSHDELQGLLQVTKAQLLASLDRWDDAAAEAERGRILFERKFGADDLRLVDALEALGRVAFHRARPADAAAYYGRSYEIQRKVLGSAHPEVAATLMNLAGARYHQIRYAEALAAYGEAMAIFGLTRAPDHPDQAKVAHNLSLVYKSLGQFDRALPLEEQAVSIGRTAFGPEHPVYGTFLMGLGNTLPHLGRSREAAARLREALAILERKLGSEHSRVATCLQYLTEALFELGRYREARPVAARSLAIYDKVYGASSANARAILLWIGRIELELGAPRRARPALERAYGLGRDGDPGQLAQIELALGRVLFATGEPTRGRAMVEVARDKLAADGRASADVAEAARWLRRH